MYLLKMGTWQVGLRIVFSRRELLGRDARRRTVAPLAREDGVVDVVEVHVASI